MNSAQLVELRAWVTEAGLSGQNEAATLTGFCERAVSFGLPLARAIVLADTLHPMYEGRAFRWNRDKGSTVLTEYGRSEEDIGRWRRSPFFYLEESGEPLLRRRLAQEPEPEFPVLAELRAAGMTDYLAVMNRFGADGTIGDLDAVYSSWATDGPAGFSDTDIGDLRSLTPLLALTVKAVSLARIAETLVETYLGKDAGRRVLNGRIARGVADRIEAVLWFSDLRGYTRFSDSAKAEEIIPLLNEYADAVVSAIHARGGDVLKLMGDGILAIFTVDERCSDCSAAALDAAQNARRAVAELNRQRARNHLPITDLYLGLHIGQVFYGNIGSKERLDFTVVGPAVNEVSRIAALCRSIDQPLLLSAAFAATLGQARNRLVSVGRYALRGVARPQELFTLEQDPKNDRTGS